VTDGPALGDWTAAAVAAERLAAAGVGRSAAPAKADLLARAARALQAAGAPAAAPARAFHVPGRIEVLGKHTDYAGGRSLLAAAERGLCLLAVPRDDSAVRMFAADGTSVEFALDPGLSPTPGGWPNYPMTVGRRIVRNFPGPLRGADLAFASDLPVAAGLSSSSALIVGTFLALSAVNRLDRRDEYRRDIRSPEDLAGYLGSVENGQGFGSLAGDSGVGTLGGSEDHAAMLCCRAGLLSAYSYCPVRAERSVPMPHGYVFAVAASGVAAEKTGPAMEQYNRASRLASAVADAWNRSTGRDDPHIEAALASGEAADTADRIRRVLLAAGGAGLFSPRELLGRFEHFLTESRQIIPASLDALEGGAPALAAFGRLAELSQRAAEKLLSNQVPQTAFLAAEARKLGAVAASAFGAGFGGSAWAMVRADRAEAFRAEWLARYRAAHPAPAARATFFLTRPGPPAAEL